MDTKYLTNNGTHIVSSVYEGPNDGGKWDVYEDALEAGLQEALKLIGFLISFLPYQLSLQLRELVKENNIVTI